MFDIINAELECLEKKKSENQKIQKDFRVLGNEKHFRHQEIQIKWREFRSLEHFKIGSSIDEIWPEYDNNWVRADYVCNTCSKKTNGEYGPFIKTDDQKRHYCFVKIENSRIKSVLNEKDFAKLGIEKYVIYD